MIDSLFCIIGGGRAGDRVANDAILFIADRIMINVRCVFKRENLSFNR